MLIGLLRDDDAYFGLLFEYLVVQIRQKFNSFSAMIIGSILEYAG
jgi:hypothetical protein